MEKIRIRKLNRTKFRMHVYLILAFSMSIIFLNCTSYLENKKNEINDVLSISLSKYPNYHLEAFLFHNNKLDIFIADSLDVNNAPYTNEFVIHFLSNIKNIIIDFDSVSIDIRMVNREDKYPEDRFYISANNIVKLIEAREKKESYNQALEWVFKNDYRIAMEILNVRYASVKGIDDLWSLDDNIFKLIELHFEKCNHPTVRKFIKETRDNLTPNQDVDNESAKIVFNNIFENCIWKLNKMQNNR